jgi:hypothetical protein
MNDDARYSLQEELVLGCALPLAPGAAICDLLGCGEPAVWLIPGAALCGNCFELSKADDGRRYQLPVGSVAFDGDVRASRRTWYETLLGELHEQDGGMRRSAERDELIQELVELAVRDLILASGGIP